MCVTLARGVGEGYDRCLNMVFTEISAAHD